MPKDARSIGVMLLAIVTTVASISFGAAQSALAVSGSLWDPGYIISDAEFYNATAMSEGDIQNFFVSHACSPGDGVPCLQNYSQTTSDRAAAGAGQCAAYVGAANESAARIVSKVALACGINPRVLLVLMQKEQSLVSNPSLSGYLKAMGWGCPDTGACDPNQLGFFNQVYKSAWQFRQYTLTASSWRYKIGVNQIQYNPNVNCGSSKVIIRNQATANLYTYTPYQPDAAALANTYGTGDDCSAYGNRNFWRIYYDWFGNPADSSPIGQIENMQPTPGGIGIWGWALDTDTTDPVWIHVYADGQMISGQLANATRTDIGSRYGYGDDHGIALQVPLASGAHNICIYAINVAAGSNLLMGCWNVALQGAPVGAVENIQPQPGGVGVWGWAVDPSTVDPVNVDFSIDGRYVSSVLANTVRGDMAVLKPGYGLNHGYGGTVAVSAGTHRICASVKDVPAMTSSTTLGCYTVTLNGDPFGSVDTLTTGIGTITATGWAIDPDTSNSILVHFYLDGTMVVGVGADQPRTDLGAFSNYGSNHGFVTTINAVPGIHTLCAYAINIGPGTVKALSCQNVQVGGSPRGAIENAQPEFGRIGIWGWTYDPDTADNNLVHVYIDGVMKGGFGAVTPRPDLASTIPSVYGINHGFGVEVPVASGSHQVCVYAINVGYGQNTPLGCFTGTVSGDPTGALENVQPADGGFAVYGYALDPDTTSSILVHAYLDGVMVGGFGAGFSRDDIGAKYPGYGSAHAYGFTIPAAPGPHTLCTYAINVGSGGNVQLGCVNVTR